MPEIEFPITVTGFDRGVSEVLKARFLSHELTGSWLSVRLVGEEGTRLGVLLGEIARGTYVAFEPKTGRLSFDFCLHNPAIWVPSLNRVVWGCESWWGVISSPEQLRNITDADIENIWYVRALKELSAKADEQESAPSGDVDGT